MLLSIQQHEKKRSVINFTNFIFQCAATVLPLKPIDVLFSVLLDNMFRQTVLKLFSDCVKEP